MESDVDQAQKEIYTMDYAAAQNELQQMTDYWARKVTRDYRNLGDYLLVKFLDGNIKKEKDGKFALTDEGVAEYPEFGGYNERYYRSIVNEAGDHFLVIPVE